jgi:hypothetical protein
MKLFICVLTFLLGLSQVYTKHSKKNILYVSRLVAERRDISNRGFIEDVIENNLFDICEHKCNDNSK